MELLSILITSWKEENTIGKAISTYTSNFSGNFEVLLAIPDEETKNSAIKTLTELKIPLRNETFQSKSYYISDFVKDGVPRGKSLELNYLMDKARGDIWFFGDGDVYYDKNVINNILEKFEDLEVFSVSGRPVSDEKMDNFWGFISHILADGAHEKRLSQMKKGKKFFPVSGYLFATRKTDIRSKDKILSEDAYLSYQIALVGKKISYAPNAKVFVKYPQNLSDFIKQKRRSTGGFLQIYKLLNIPRKLKSRSFFQEIKFFWFPLKYIKKPRHLIWLFRFYILRVYLWLNIFFDQKIKKLDLMKSGSWERIKSTK